MERRSRGAVIESIELPVEVVIDSPPSVISAGQWAKGAYPSEPMRFDDGDPHGRLVFVLLDEAIDDNQSPGFRVGEKVAGGALVQRGDRLLAYLLNGPLGLESNLTGELTNLVDRAGNVEASVNVDVSLDADRGVGAQVRGQVVDPRGKGIPFAIVDHYGGVFCQMCNYGEGELLEVRLGSYIADINGYYTIDYVLQNAYDGLPHIKVVAEDPLTGIRGEAKSDVIFDGQSMRLDILLRGYGDVVGQLVDQNGQPLTFDFEPSLSVTHLQGGDAMAPIVYSDGSFALRAQVGSVLLRASGTINGDLWSGVTSVLIPEVDTRVEVSLGMMTNASYGSVSGRILEAGGFVGAADAILQIRADVFAGLDSGGATFSNRVVGTVISDAAGNFSFPRCSGWKF